MTDLFDGENTEQDMSLFEPEPVDASAANTSSSDKNLIAQSAIIKGGDPVGNYAQLSQMSEEERKVATVQIGEEAKQREQDASIEMIGQLLQNPDLPWEAQVGMVQVAADGVDNGSLQRTAEAIYSTPSGRETESQERRLATVGELISPVIELTKLKQDVINSFATSEDGEAVSLGNNLGDFAELFTPFLEQAYMYNIRQKIGTGEISTAQDILNAAMLGESKVDGREAYLAMSLDEKKEYLEGALNVFNSIKTFNVFNDNDLIQLDNIMSIVQEGYYGAGERTLENIGSILDAIPGVNLLYRAGLRPIGKAAKLKTLNMLQKTGLRRFASKKQPASVQSLAEQVNPDMARAMAKDVDGDTTGEVAEVVTGTTRTEAQVEAHGPQIATPDGSVVVKPYALDRDILAAAYDETSRFYRSPGEIARTAEKIGEDITTKGFVQVDARGVVRVDELQTSPRALDSGKISISEMYTTPDGGFHSAQEAIKTTMQKLEYYGIKEEDITVMQRQGGEYVPTTIKDVGAKAAVRESLVKKKKKLPDELLKVNMQDDFAVKVDFEYSPRAIDVTGAVDGKRVRDETTVGKLFGVKLNFLDSLSSHAPVPGKTTPSRHLFPVSALLDTKISQGGVLAVDQGNRLQKVIMDKYKQSVADPIDQLPRASGERLLKIIDDQVISRKWYSQEELLDIGVVKQDEINILDNWRYLQDQRWHLSNRDLNTTLRNKGYSKYLDTDSGDELIGKVMPPNAPRPKTVYDPSTGKTRLTPEVWAKMEEEGGKVFELRSPQLMKAPNMDEAVEVKHIIVRGAEQNRYIKAIQETDPTLNYVQGGGHIIYKDPFFIERQLVDAHGVEAGPSQAVLTSPDSTSGAIALSRFQENASNALKGRTWKYTLRNSNDIDPIDITMKNFEVAETAGLSSQRRRGQTLKSFDSTSPERMIPNVADPLESFKHQAAELSKRVVIRDFLDDLEQRIIDQVGTVLPKNDFGKPRLPKPDEKLSGGDVYGSAGAKLVADARTMIEYYNYMKFGYLNNVDKGWKRSINKISQIVGKASITAEKAVLAVGEEVPSITGALKGMSFNAHIALSAPPSQWLVQGLPALKNSLLHPKYVGSGQIVRDLSLLKTAIVSGDNPKALIKAVGKTKANEILQLRKEWDRTGLGVGVDKHLIVETGLEGMMETGKLKKTKAVHDAIVDTGRKAGFDVGETFQLMAFWLAARNDAIKAGKSMDNARHFDEVRAKTRVLTMNMNKAGEMPWNKNSLSLWTQFMISPYKSLTMLLDRGLTAEERIKIGVWQTLVMPMPVYLTAQVRAQLGVEGSEGDLATEVVTNGLMGGLFNTAVNAVYGDAGSASWQRNVQLDPTFAGPLSFVQDLAKDPQGANVVQQAIQAAPALAMVNPWGYNPIALNVIKSVGGLIASPIMDEKERLYAMKEFSDAMSQYSALGRGLSAAYKDIFSDTAGKRFSALSGKLQDSEVSLLESIARGGFGLETTRQTVDREANVLLWDASKESKSDVDLIFKELSREATIQGFNMGDPKRAEHLMSHFSLAFPDGRIPPKAASYFLSKLKPNMPLTQVLFSNMGWGSGESEKVLEILGDSHPELRDSYEYIQSEKAVEALREER